jgi:aminoglycoside phosphotransferase (APT) family kinase protein
VSESEDTAEGSALPPQPDHEAYRAPLTDWLLSTTGATSVDITEFRPPKSGYSAETVMFNASIDRGDGAVEERLVLRKDTDDDPVYPTQGPGTHGEVELQWLTMASLGRISDVPLAPIVGFEPDSAVLGNPFFVMGFVEGEVPVEDPPYTQAGFFVDATPAQRTTMVDNGLAAMAQLHRADWQAEGFDWLVNPEIDRTGLGQLDVWERQCRHELGDRVHGPFEDAVAWLRANPPTDEGDPVLCWGDPRPGNVIWNDFAPVALTDFEASSISPRGVDLGWWLMFDRFSHAASGVSERLPGEPDFADQVKMYEAHAGVQVNNIYWYELLGAARYCAIVVRIMNRFVARGLMPEDQTIWLDNPATVVTQELLELRP